MCSFFSFCGDGHGNYLYADWAERVRLKHQEADSHTAILTRAKIPPAKQELWSCYEYNPLTKAFVVDKAVEGHDTEAARNWVEARDWKAIVEPLIVKPIINPLNLKPPKITKKHIALLKKWDSVWDSVGDSVWDSVRASVRDSVWASVRASVWDSVGAYVSSFFTIAYKYDFSPAITLWECGLVPSFDGKIWRLHGGEKAKVLYEWEPEKGVRA